MTIKINRHYGEVNQLQQRLDAGYTAVIPVSRRQMQNRVFQVSLGYPKLQQLNLHRFAKDILFLSPRNHFYLWHLILDDIASESWQTSYKLTSYTCKSIHSIAYQR